MDELTWRLSWGSLRVDRVRAAVEQVAREYPGVTVRVEVEDSDCISAFFDAPGALVASLTAALSGEEEVLGAEVEEPPQETYTLELSFYDLDRDGCVFALEGEWSDNNAAWDVACQLAEDLAENLDAEPLDL